MLRNIRKEELKEQIFLQSMALFQEKGFDNVTVEEITRACGIAKGTFYNYFPKKEAILLHLGMLQMESAKESLKRYDNLESLKEKLNFLFQDLFARFSIYPDLARLTIAEMMRSSLLIQAELSMVELFQSELEVLIEAGKKKGQVLEQLTASDVAAVVAGVYFYCLMVWASSDMGADEMRATFERRFEVVWGGICPKLDVGGERA